jgi:gamma-glutamylcyclotransferase (GGCT)/AIG2-like uncharacterized protein YtfP
VITSVFVYGTLMPGESRWASLAPYAVGEPQRDKLAGRLVDSGCGYPGLIDLGADDAVHGWVVELDPHRTVDALAHLDEIEGTGIGLYVREFVRTFGGRTCWTYRYLHATDGMTDLRGSWM